MPKVKLTEWDLKFIQWLTDNIDLHIRSDKFIKYFDKKYKYKQSIK
jgi:hypothetical protein